MPCDVAANMAQSAARGSHNPKVVSSNLTVRIFHYFPLSKRNVPSHLRLNNRV